MTKVYTIGVSGPSCSGKTADDQIPIDQTSGLANWDCPDAIDFKSLTRTISHVRTNNGQFPKWYQSKAVKNDHDKQHILSDQSTEQLGPWLKNFQPDTMFLIVEGFMLYQDEDLCNEIDCKLFITASYETLKTRREARKGYATKLGTWVDPPGYFDDIVWPQYVRWNRQENVAQAMMVFNTDRSSIEETSSRAVDYLHTQFI
ncbi:hypothetical protein CLU79DRAFT_694562 [Phycomyces nitens]|nr:hypothetical protein CLU79DRAFT_694562 [Phycomyces nitens]